MSAPCPLPQIRLPRAESGELRLIAAVLRLAIEDARRGDRDACDWLASDESGAFVGGVQVA